MGNQSSTPHRAPLLLDSVVVVAGADGNVSLGSARPLSTDRSSVELFFTESLVEMGIDRDLAARAVAATRGESLIAAVDWVFNHRPLDRAPSPAARDEARTWPAQPTAPAPVYRVLRRVANFNTSTLGSFPSMEAQCSVTCRRRHVDQTRTPRTGPCQLPILSTILTTPLRMTTHQSWLCCNGLRVIYPPWRSALSSNGPSVLS